MGGLAYEDGLVTRAVFAILTVVVLSLPVRAQDAVRSPQAEERNRALAAARESAVSRLVDSLRPIEVGDGKTVGDALAIPEAGTVVNDWLGSRPVTSVDFHDDLSVRITMSVPVEEFWQVL